MKFRYLLAKKAEDENSPRPEETIVGHTVSVLSAAAALNNVLEKDIVNLFNPDINLQFWRDAFLAAAWLHDLGKANDHFQKQIRDRNFRQGIRHETLGFVLIFEHLQQCLDQIQKSKGYPDWFGVSVIIAVSGHHLKFPDSLRRQGTDICFLGDHPDTKRMLGLGKMFFEFLEIPNISDITFSLKPFGGIRDKIAEITKRVEAEFTPEQKLFIALLKSFLMCADVAGSALPKRLPDESIPNIHDWLLKRIRPVLTQSQLEDVVQDKLKGACLKPFQTKVIETKLKSVLIEAGCGAGKTAAAYAWAAKNAHLKRLFFCYPTIATSAEGFSGYLQDPDFEAILVNSRADVDYRLLENLPEQTESLLEFRDLQLETLETWPIPAVVCTVHTVLGILQNYRRGICILPSMVRSAFVFDEIHSYSPKLFAHFLRFIEIFSNVPVLMMTATLPPIRKKLLETICRKRGGLFKVGGPPKRENAKRYQLVLSGENEAWEKASEIIASGGKVLWVCNTVPRAMTLVEKALEMNIPVEPFHSRYRYKDRLKRQRKVIDGFLPGKPAMLAITTQVAEMSLDLSADLLISEYAPIASLIQRLGRLNRFEDEPVDTKTAILLKPPNAYPYIQKKDEETAFWERIEAWLKMVADGLPKSQNDLAKAFITVEENHGKDGEVVFCDWIDDPLTSLKDRRALMEPGYNIEVVRQEDMKLGPLDENAIPMPVPRGDTLNYWCRKGRYYISPISAVDYDDFKGGTYATENNEAWII